MGSLWDIEEVKAYAKNLLNGLKLSPIRQLDFAKRYAVHEWVRDAVKELIPANVLSLGTVPLKILFQAKTSLECERIMIAHVAPKLAAEKC
jgi:hypothetical protein